MDVKERCGGLDLFKMIAAFLVVAIHTSPLESFSPEADFFFTRILCRIAVPFFFMVTGQFVLSGYLREKIQRSGRFPLWQYMKKVLFLYGIAILIYLPVGIYAGHYKGLTILSVFRMLLFDGTFYHLWYFPGLIVGILLFLALWRICPPGWMAPVVTVLYLLGLLGDSYWGLVQQAKGISAVYEWCFGIFSYTRNGIFFAPLFLWMGAWLGNSVKTERMTHQAANWQANSKTVQTANWQVNSRNVQTDSRIWDAVGLALTLLFMTAEGFWLRNLQWQRHDSMYLMLPFCMFFLYRLLLGIEIKIPRNVPTASTWVYMLHPALIVAVRIPAKIPAVGKVLGNSLVFYLTVSVLSGISAFFMAWLLGKRKKQPLGLSGKSEKSSVRDGEDLRNAKSVQDGESLHNPECFQKGRAWLELDREALRYNVSVLTKRLSKGCKLMPAIKADAYGHGAVGVAKELAKLGIDAFCVACIKEGIELRKHGIQGDILILGYTHPRQFGLLYQYGLIQTVVDYSYATQLNSYGKELRVHVKIDTGMRRLGERSDHRKQLMEICRMEHLKIEGAFTHLCVDDTDVPQDVEFTKAQARAFYQVIQEWEQQGFSCPKVHLLASYGVLNYPSLGGDYARVGIALYGVRSARSDYDGSGLRLGQVLSLKARVAAVRELCPGEGAGYGLTFVASRPMKIATLSIGYGDGLPRNLSSGVGSVLIRGRRVPVVGRICMDQTMVDVTGILDVRPGDVGVLIGSSGSERISVYEMAEQSGTITNEILSRLGSRLERVWE